MTGNLPEGFARTQLTCLIAVLPEVPENPFPSVTQIVPNDPKSAEERGLM